MGCRKEKIMNLFVNEVFFKNLEGNSVKGSIGCGTSCTGGFGEVGCSGSSCSGGCRGDACYANCTGGCYDRSCASSCRTFCGEILIGKVVAME